MEPGEDVEPVVVESVADLERRMSQSNSQIIINQSNIDIWLEYRGLRLITIR